jgi:hypothetical protein
MSIRELEEIERAMTPAPWAIGGDDPLVCEADQLVGDVDHEDGPVHLADLRDERMTGDGHGIVTFRNAMPALLAIAKAALVRNNAHFGSGDAGEYMARIQETELALSVALKAVRP